MQPHPVLLDRHAGLMRAAAALALLLIACGPSAGAPGAAGGNVAGGSAPATKPAGAAPPAPSANQAAGSAQGGAPLKLALSNSLSGGLSVLGVPQRYGTELAVDDVNNRGGVGGRRIDLTIEDSGSSNTQAVNAYNKVAAEGPVAIFQSGVSTQNFAISQLADKAGIPTLVNGTSSAVTRQGIRWLWRTQAHDDFLATVATRFALDDLHLTRIAVLYINDEYGTGANKTTEEVLRERNLRPAAQEAFGGADKDWAAQLLSIQRAGAEAVIMHGYPAQIAGVIKQRKQLGIDVPFIGEFPPVMPTTLDLLTDDEANGIYGVTPSLPTASDDPDVRAWVERFRQRFGIEPDMLATSYYDAVLILADAVRRAGGDDHGKVMDAILATRDFKGIGTTYTFDDKGDSVQVAIVTRNNGKHPEIVKRY